jgi:hypothetical protein
MFPIQSIGRKARNALWTACLPALLLLPLRADELPVVTVRNVTVSVKAVSEDYLVLRVRFEGDLRSQTKRKLRLASEPVLNNAVDRRGPDGWSIMADYHSYFSGDEEYQECRTIKRGDKLHFPHVEATVIVNKNDPDAHTGLVVRFYLTAACKDGTKTPIETLVTEPVDLKIPAW